MSSVCTVLEKYQHTDGPHLSKVNSGLLEFEGVQLQQQGRQQFLPTKSSVLVNVQKAMERRFDDSKSGGKKTDDSWVKALVDHFAKPLTTTGVDCDLILIE